MPNMLFRPVSGCCRGFGSPTFVMKVLSVMHNNIRINQSRFLVGVILIVRQLCFCL